MRVSQWMRQYQLTGAVPDGESPEFAFWCGWLLAHSRNSLTVTNLDEARAMAVRAAEFIESRARE